MGSLRRRRVFGAPVALAGVLGLVAAMIGAVPASSQTATGFLEVCKETDPTGPVYSDTFSFTIAGRPGTLTAPVGSCAGLVEVAAGEVTITEAARDGFELTGIRADPFPRMVSSSTSDRTATVTVVAGDSSTQTIVFFKNRKIGEPVPPPPPNNTPPPDGGRMKICKIAGPGVVEGTVFTFAFANGFLTVPAGPASQNGFCTFDGVLPLGMEVTISEAVPSGMRVSAVTVTPAARLVGAPDLAGGRVVLRVGEGINEVTFRNEVTPTPPTPPPPVKCTYTRGFYQTHETVVDGLIGASGGALSVGGVNLYASQVDMVLERSAVNYLNQLSAQVITAKLNQLGGASFPSGTATVIAAADALIAQQGGPLVGTALPSTTVTYQGATYTASELTDVLTAFNEGRASGGPRSCR